MSQLFSTFFPYIILIWTIKSLFFLKNNVDDVKCLLDKKRIGITLLITIFLFLNIEREGIITYEKLKSLLCSVLVFLALFICVLLSVINSKVKHRWYIVGAILLAFFSATGNKFIFDTQGWWGYFLSFSSWSILFYFFLESCDWLLNRCRWRVFPKKANDWWIWGVVTFLVSTVVFGIFLLAFYPGVMVYDSLMQMFQVTGGAAYSNHHPWLHTMLIKGIYELGLQLLKSSNRAYSLYSMLSACYLAFAFSIVVSYLRKKGIRGKYLILIIAGYLLSPINQMYAISMCKDTPFGATVLIFIVLLCIMRDNIQNKKSNIMCYILFIPIVFGVCFFRSNGLYVFLGMIPFLLWAFWREKGKIITVISIVLILGFIYKGPIFSYYNVTEPDLIESLSIPAQQIAAVIAFDGDITDEQIALLENVVDCSQVTEKYIASPGCSDNIKNLVRESNNQEYIKEHIFEFLELYLDLFKKNSRIYINAFIDETGGYWYHRVFYPILWYTYVEDNGMGIYRSSQLPDKVVNGIREYFNLYQKLWDVFGSVGIIIYLFFISLFIALQKQSKYLIAYLPCLGIWGTLLIATPVHADIRYAYSIFIAAPLLLMLSAINEEQKDMSEG